MEIKGEARFSAVEGSVDTVLLMASCMLSALWNRRKIYHTHAFAILHVFAYFVFSILHVFRTPHSTFPYSALHVPSDPESELENDIISGELIQAAELPWIEDSSDLGLVRLGFYLSRKCTFWLVSVVVWSGPSNDWKSSRSRGKY